MKNIKQQLSLLTIFLLTSLLAMAQARLVINGGIIIIDNGASFIIDNPDNTAITFNGTGNIQSEAPATSLSGQLVQETEVIICSKPILKCAVSKNSY